MGGMLRLLLLASLVAGLMGWGRLGWMGSQNDHAPISSDVLSSKKVDVEVQYEPNGQILGGYIEALEFRAPMTPICRFHRACRTVDGQIVLPGDLQEYHEEIMARCRLSDSPQWPEGPLYGIRRENQSILVRRSKDGESQDFSTRFVRNADLLCPTLAKDGDLELLFHIPNFMFQLVPWIFATEALKDPSNGVRAVVYRADNRTAIPSPMQAPGLSSPMLRLRPAMFRESLARNKRWTATFLRKMKAVGFSFEQTPTASLSCYQSIIVQANTMDRLPSSIFRYSELNREGLKGLHADVAKLKAFRVGIFDRSRSRARRFSDVKSLSRKLGQLLRQSPFRVELDTFHMEGGTSLEFQIKKMQSLDVVISPWGAGLTNVLFMRPGTLAIEVVPFGEPSNHGHFANTSDVAHVAVYGSPDPASVNRCINEAVKVRPGSSAEATSLIYSFSRWSRVQPRGEYYTPHDFAGEEIRKDLHTSRGLGRLCIRDHQLLTVNPALLHRIISNRIQLGQLDVSHVVGKTK